VDLPRRPSVLPACQLLDFKTTTLLLVVLVLLGGLEPGMVPGSPPLALPAMLGVVVALVDKDPLGPTLPPSLLSSKVSLDGGCE
jgi:hypothetical protein